MRQSVLSIEPTCCGRIISLRGRIKRDRAVKIPSNSLKNVTGSQINRFSTRLINPICQGLIPSCSLDAAFLGKEEAPQERCPYSDQHGRIDPSLNKTLEILPANGFRRCLLHLGYPDRASRESEPVGVLADTRSSHPIQVSSGHALGKREGSPPFYIRGPSVSDVREEGAAHNHRHTDQPYKPRRTCRCRAWASVSSFTLSMAFGATPTPI